MCFCNLNINKDVYIYPRDLNITLIPEHREPGFVTPVLRLRKPLPGYERFQLRDFEFHLTVERIANFYHARFNQSESRNPLIRSKMATASDRARDVQSLVSNFAPLKQTSYYYSKRQRDVRIFVACRRRRVSGGEELKSRGFKFEGIRPRSAKVNLCSIRGSLVIEDYWESYIKRLVYATRLFRKYLVSRQR